MVIGCGIIGMEMASVYQALGSRVVLLEYADTILFGVDNDIRKTFEKEIFEKYEIIYMKSKITDVEETDDGITIKFLKDGQPITEHVNKVLIAVGRKPKTENLGLEKIGVNLTDNGFICADEQYQTSVNGIYAIGDVIGGPRLAHKASHEGKNVSEICMNHKINNKAATIPAVIYTNPEVAWIGVTETMAKNDGIDYKITKVYWNVNGRLLCHSQKNGLTKILIDPNSDKIIGASIVGPNAGEVITKLTLAIDLELTSADLSNIIHPHPSFSETTLIATENYLGIATDVIS